MPFQLTGFYIMASLAFNELNKEKITHLNFFKHIRICSKSEESIEETGVLHCTKNQIFLRIWIHLLKKSFMKNFIFCEVFLIYSWRALTRLVTAWKVSLFSQIWTRKTPNKENFQAVYYNCEYCKMLKNTFFKHLLCLLSLILYSVNIFQEWRDYSS